MTKSKPSETKQLAPIDELKGTISKMEPQFALALPKHIPVERFVRVVQTAISTSPQLADAERTSLFAAAMKAAQDGLLPDGREAAIVTFRAKIGGDKWVNKAQYMPMVAGILKKMRNSGEISMITSNVIYEHDEFKYWVDQDGEHMTHTPNLFIEDRGSRRGVYAFARTKDGAVYIEVMTAKQVLDVKGVSKSKDSGPWSGPFEDEMWRKTGIKRLSKRMPMSTDLEMTIRADDELFEPPSKTAPGETDVTGTTEPEPPPPKPVKSSRLAGAMGLTKTVSTDEPPQEGEVLEGESESIPESEVPI